MGLINWQELSTPYFLGSSFRTVSLRSCLTLAKFLTLELCNLLIRLVNIFHFTSLIYFWSWNSSRSYSWGLRLVLNYIWAALLSVAGPATPSRPPCCLFAKCLLRPRSLSENTKLGICQNVFPFHLSNNRTE